MTDLKNIKLVFDFLIVQFNKQYSFSLDQLAKVSNWSLSDTQKNVTERLDDLLMLEGKITR